MRRKTQAVCDGSACTSFVVTLQWTCADGERVTACAHFFPHMLHGPALRADSLPWLSVASRLLRALCLLVALDALQAFRIRPVYRALRVNSCSGVRDFSAHGAAFSQPILIQWYRLSIVYGCLLRHPRTSLHRTAMFDISASSSPNSERSGSSVR